MTTETNETNFSVEVNRADSALAVKRRYALWSGGFGIIPVPLVDLALIGGAQVKMVQEISKVYEIPFSETRVKALIGALVGTVGTYGAASLVIGGVTSLLKAIPVVGGIAALTIGPALGYASTWAVGSVFTQHFSRGGTLHDFVPDEARDLYDKEFAAARKHKPTEDVVSSEKVEDVTVNESKRKSST